MIKCEWKYCKYNELSGVCHKENITLRCATVDDLIDEDIIDSETELSKNNCGSVLICADYISMD